MRPTRSSSCRGPSACPAESRIGSGYVLSDTGGRDPFPRYTRTTITSFNNQGEVIGLGINDDIPAIRAVDRTKVGDRSSTTNFPVFPGVPPPEPYTPYGTLHMQFPPYVRGGRAYNRTPPTCPPVGHWTLTREFIYHDGVSVRLIAYPPRSAAFELFARTVAGTDGQLREAARTVADRLDFDSVVRATPGALGFAPFDLGRHRDPPPLVALDGGGGCVRPSVKTVRSRAYETLSAPLYMYSARDSLQERAVKSFVDYVLDASAEVARYPGLVPPKPATRPEAEPRP